MVSPLLLVAAFSLSQTLPFEPGRSVAVIPTNTSELGKQLEQHVRLALAEAKVPLSSVEALRVQEAMQCENNRLCFALLGRTLGTFAVVRVEAAVVGSDIAVLIEAIESANGKLIREESFVIPHASVDSQMPLRLAPVAVKIFSSLPPARAIVLAEARPNLILDNPALRLGTSSQPRSSFPIWVTGAGAVVFAGASAGLLAYGATARNCLHGGPVEGSPTVCVPQGQVGAMQQQADVGLIAGSAAAAIAIGLTITAIVQHVSAN